MKNKHVEIYLAEFNKQELGPDLSIRIQQHLSVCGKCRNSLEDVKSVERIMAASRKDHMEASPFLKTRIDANLDGGRKLFSLDWLRPRVLVPVLSLLVVVASVLFIAPGSTSPAVTATIDLAEIQDYALANPDLMMAYINAPTTYNRKQILEALYTYAVENEWTSDPDKLYDYYKFIVSNAEEFI